MPGCELQNIMNPILLCAFALAALFFVSACAHHEEPAPATSTTTTSETQEVHTY